MCRVSLPCVRVLPDTVVISETVFSANMDDDTPSAEVIQVYGIKPLLPPCCCVYRYPLRTSIKSHEALEDANMVGVFSLLPLMQSGKAENASCCPRFPLLPAATGSCCDCGRRVTFKRMAFEDMINETEAEAEGGGAPAGAVHDDGSSDGGALSRGREVVLHSTKQSKFLKSMDEINAMPSKPWLGIDLPFLSQEVVITTPPMGMNR